VPFEGLIPQTDISISYLEVAAIAAYIGPDLNRHTVLTCKSGGMSTYAGNQLIALGYKHIEHLTGGMMAWKAAGYSLVFP
jgi:rhodanese-related sulfurtransferase